MRIYRSDGQFEAELVAVLAAANSGWQRSTAYFRRYLGEGVFSLYVIDGNIRTSHETWIVDVKLVDGKLEVVDEWNESMLRCESYSYQYETHADIFQEKVNHWVSPYGNLSTPKSYDRKL